MFVKIGFRVWVRRLLRFVLFWSPMVLQLDITPLDFGFLGFAPPFVRCDTGHYEEGEMYDPVGRTISRLFKALMEAFICASSR